MIDSFVRAVETYCSGHINAKAGADEAIDGIKKAVRLLKKNP